MTKMKMLGRVLVRRTQMLDQLYVRAGASVANICVFAQNAAKIAANFAPLVAQDVVSELE